METDKKVQETLDKINKMSRFEMAEMWRFSPLGHPYFDSTKPYFKAFKKRFKELGGFSPEISKALG